MVGVVSGTQLLADELGEVRHLSPWRFGNDFLQDPPTWLKNKLWAADVNTADGQLTDRSTSSLWLHRRVKVSQQLCHFSAWPHADPPLSRENTARVTYISLKSSSQYNLYTVHVFDNFNFPKHSFELREEKQSGVVAW